MKRRLSILLTWLTICMFAESTETTLWEAAYTGEIEINNSQIATFQAGDVLRVYLTVPDTEIAAISGRYQDFSVTARPTTPSVKP